MPPLLGAADSFNSSTATIKADNSGNQRSRTSALGPQDSVGREFEALIRGNIGVLQSDTGVGNVDHLSRYLRESATLPGEVSFSNPPNNISNSNNTTIDTTSFNPLSFIADPSQPDASFFPDEEVQTASASTTFQPTAATSNAFSGPAFVERPSSALSHRSARSDYSYSTTEGSYATTDGTATDDDGDSVMSNNNSASASPSPLNEIGALNLGAPTWNVGNTPLNGPPSTIAPSSQALGSSSRNMPPPPTVPAPTRRRSHAVSFGPEDEDAKREARLEHRRSINRRSAQKHRLRRKEELEEMAKKVAERDRRIQDLEREVAVLKGNLATVLALVHGKQQQQS